MSSLAHLMLMGRAGHVTTSNPNSINLVTPFNMTRLQGIPILFFSGGENTVFDPQSTDISYTMLRDTFGEEWYERVVFEGRGHLDCVRMIDLLEFFVFCPRNMCSPSDVPGSHHKKDHFTPKDS
jgi:choline dehydrogenase-like flavoprotein